MLTIQYCNIKSPCDALDHLCRLNTALSQSATAEGAVPQSGNECRNLCAA